MRRIINWSPLSKWLSLIAWFILILSLQGCAIFGKVKIEPWFSPSYPEEEIKQNEFSIAKEDDIIGRLAFIRLEKEDTLPDIARHFSLGINEISAANPGVDIWVPDAGKRIMLPLSFILPTAPKKGIVINLAAMRLFQFKGDGKSLKVSTYPVGIGTSERPTPMGQMYVERKMIRPTWHVPASISEDHRKKGDPLPAIVLPGPENPLGEYALYLSKSTYLVHGTNKPSSIGLKATNGCIRLYPEDVKKLYNDTPINTPVCIVNQPYLIGRRNGIIYLEAHAPLEDSGAAELKKMYTKLKIIEKNLHTKLTGKKLRQYFPKPGGFLFPYPRSGK